MSEWRRDIAMLMRQECNKARKNRDGIAANLGSELRALDFEVGYSQLVLNPFYLLDTILLDRDHRFSTPSLTTRPLNKGR